MQIATIAGNVGKDAEFKTTQQGDQLCRFSVAVSTGWGDRKATTWWDVTRWGKGAEKLAGFVRKGAKVSVSGEISTREHEGKTYLQIRADHVTLQGVTGGDRDTSGRDTHEQRRDANRAHQDTVRTGGGFGGSRGGFADDMDDDVPFASCDASLDLPRSHRVRVI